MINKDLIFSVGCYASQSCTWVSKCLSNSHTQKLILCIIYKGQKRAG